MRWWPAIPPKLLLQPWSSPLLPTVSKVNEIKGDSLGVIKLTAQDYAGTISGSAKGLAGENNIEAKRKEFKMIADALYTPVPDRTIQRTKNILDPLPHGIQQYRRLLDQPGLYCPQSLFR